MPDNPTPSLAWLAVHPSFVWTTMRTELICMELRERRQEESEGSPQSCWLTISWLDWQQMECVWFMRPIFDHYGWSQTSLERGGWLGNEQTNVLLLHSGCNLSCRSHACVILTKSVQFLFPFLSSSCQCDRPGAYKCAFLILLALFCCRIYQTKDELSIFPDLTSSKPKTKFLFYHLLKFYNPLES